MLKIREFRHHEIPVLLNVAHRDFQDVIVIPADVKAFLNFRELGNLSLELRDVFFLMLAEIYMAQHQEIFLNKFSVNQSHIFFDDFQFFEFFYALENSRNRKLEVGSQTFGGSFGVFLK